MTAQPTLNQTVGVQLNWTNPAPVTGAAATGIEVLRSTNGGSFAKITTVSASATSYSDPGPLATGKTYTYELIALNQVGTSAPSGKATVDLTHVPPVLTITSVTASAISLSWTAVANNQYVVQQSTDGVNFTTIATMPASQTTYTVTGLAPGTYAFQIDASSVNPTSNAVSNTAGTTVGAVINPDGGFDNTTALTANGSTEFGENVARITDDDDQTGSVFSNNRITIRSFTTSFQIRFHEGTQPNYADGIAFVIQANRPTALGLGAGALGYQTIGSSIAIKLDTFENPGDPSDSSTGLFEQGAAPTSGIDTTSNNGPLIDSQAPKLVTLSYDGTTLTETITNTLDPTQVFTTSYKVNIAAVIGSDTAYVGFTGATGDGDYWELQDVTSWTFTSTAPLPGAPSQLKVVKSTSSEIDLSWTSNSYNETGFAIYRSIAGGSFSQIGTATGTTYQDTSVGAGPYRYRVAAYNTSGNSPNSNTVIVTATPTITWNSPASITFGTALGSAQLDASASVAGTYVYTPAAGTVLHAGNNQTLSVVFTPTDTTDYTAATATTTISVSQATPTITWNGPASITFGTVLGSAQLDASASVPGTFAYTPAAGTVLDAGDNQTLSVLFTPTDTTDYAAATATTTISVSQATPTIAWNSPASITFGTALGSAQLDASASVAGTYVYTPAAGTVLHAGNNQTLSVVFTPTDTTDYTAATATTTISVSQATPTITWNGPASITFGTVLGSAQLDASASVPGTFAYTPAAGTVLDAGDNQTLSVLFTPTDTTDYTAASVTTTISVSQATPTITWNGPASITFGTALGSAQLDASTSVAGTFTYTPAAGTVLGAGDNQTLSVLFTPTDTTDYTAATATTTISVSQATPTITWNSPASITFGTALGSAQLDASASVAGTYVYTPAAGAVLDAGNNQTLSVLFTPTDTTDYTTASVTTTISVSQATPTITWNSLASITFGTALGSAQLDASASVPGTFAYTPAAGTVLDAGDNQTLSVLFTPTDTTDYAAATATTTISVSQATPTITWNSPASITFGTALGSAQLDASASVAGTYVYTPAAGTVLDAGNNQTLSVVFTPTDTTDYAAATATTTISVSQATPTITWTSPASITFGTALGSAQLDASASVAGTYVYTPAAGTVLDAGNDQTLSVVFTPTDTTDYTTATVTTTISVSQATPTITWASPASITFGTALGSAQLDASASVAGTFAYTPAAGAVLDAGNNQTLSVVFTPTDTTDYTTATVTTTISVSQATPTINWNSPASITFGTPLGSAQLDASASVAGTYVYTPAAGTVLHAGDNQTLSVVFTPTDETGHTTVSVTTTISVSQATPTITWTGPVSITYGTALGSAQLDASASAAGTFAYTPAAGTVLHAGDNQTLSVVFAPTDTTDYATTSATVLIDVAPAPLTIQVSNQTITYGGSMATPTVGYIGLVNSDAPAIFRAAGNSPPSFNSVLPNLHVGNYSLTASGASDNDYTIAYVPGTLSINPAPLTIAANNATMFSGQAVPALTASYSGFQNGDTPASLDSLPTLSTSATSASSPGSYAITVAGATSNDYTISFVNGSLTVDPALVTLQSVSLKNQRVSKHTTIRVIVIQFSGGLNGSDAAVLRNYTLGTVPTGKHHKSRNVTLSHASYDAVQNTVTLRTSKNLVLTVPLQVTIKSPGLVDTLGRPLAGNLVLTLRKRS